MLLSLISTFALSATAQRPIDFPTRRPPIDCLMCIQAVPTCETSCTECEVTPQTCTECPRAICHDSDPINPTRPPTNDCVMCTQAVPTCESSCSNCEVIPQTCQQCSRAVCKDGPKYNCLTREMWTQDKKDWCCENEQLGCPQTACEDMDDHAEKLFNFDFTGVDDCLSAVKFLELQALGTESEGCDIPLADYEAFGLLNMPPRFATLREMCCESCALPSVCTIDADSYRSSTGVCEAGEESFTLYCDETNCISNPECSFEDFGLDMDDYPCEDDCITCTVAVPQCEPGCMDCKIRPQTCKSCSEAICNDRGFPGFPGFPPFPPTGDCVMCTQAIPTCESSCSNCEVTPQTCRQCSRAICMDGPGRGSGLGPFPPIGGLPDSETSELCKKIVEQDACDQSCEYAFKDSELAGLLPTWLSMDICRGMAGSYRLICAVECVMADLGLGGDSGSDSGGDGMSSGMGSGMASGGSDHSRCYEQTFIDNCVASFIDNGGCEFERQMQNSDGTSMPQIPTSIIGAVNPKCFMCDNIGDIVEDRCEPSNGDGSSEPETPLQLLKHMIEEAEDFEEAELPTEQKQLKKIKKNMTKLNKLLAASKRRVQNAIKAAKN